MGYNQPLRSVSAVLGIAGVFALAVFLTSWKAPTLLPRALVFCGKYSLQLFILHIIFAAGMRVILLRFGVQIFYLHLVIGTIAGVAFPLIAATLDQRFFGWAFRPIAGAGKRTYANATTL